MSTNKSEPLKIGEQGTLLFSKVKKWECCFILYYYYEFNVAQFLNSVDESRF